MFDIIILMLVGYSSVTSMYYVAFTTPSQVWHKALDWIVETFFYVDIVLNFFQEYRDSETYTTVRSLKKIAIRYVFKGWFVVDFVTVFPFTLILTSNGLVTKLFRLFRLPRMI